MVYKVKSLKGVVSCLASMVDNEFLQWINRKILDHIVQ